METKDVVILVSWVLAIWLWDPAKELIKDQIQKYHARRLRREFEYYDSQFTPVQMAWRLRKQGVSREDILKSSLGKEYADKYFPVKENEV